MNIVNTLDALFHNPVCWSCGLMHAGEALTCVSCQEKIKLIEQPCRQCGLAQLQYQHICARCILKPTLWSKMVAPLAYQEPIRGLIRQLKYQGRLGVLASLVELALPYFRLIDPKPELLVPVPLHLNRFRERGFNQSFEITLLLSKALNIPFADHLVFRVVNTDRQTGLKFKQRQKNIKNAFHVEPQIAQYQHIALVDDVVTTGSTVHELSKNCLKLGVSMVDVWALARTEIDR